MINSQPPSPPLPHSGPQRAPQRAANRPTDPVSGMTLLEAVVVFLVIGILLAILLPALAPPNHRPRYSCENNLKRMGIVYKMYSGESKGELYPELSAEAGRLMFSLNQSQDLSSEYGDVYPEYLTDLNVLLCPMDSGTEELRPATQYGSYDPDLIIDDHSYFYLGYAVKGDAEMAAFAEAYRAQIDTGEAFLGDLKVPATENLPYGRTIRRLRKGVERFYITDSFGHGKEEQLQAALPIMIERPDNHIPTGGNVLFLDGHVEFIPYPGKWPMTEKTIGLLNSLDALGQ